MVQFKMTAGIGRPAQANISIPSNDEAHEILPRTVVHVFFYEDGYELGATPTQYANGQTATSKPVSLVERLDSVISGNIAKVNDYNDIMNWKLLFTGEVVGYGFSKIGGIRNVNLICQDFSTYWSMAQMYWGGNYNNARTRKKAIFLGATRLYQGGKSEVNGRNTLTKLLTAKPSGMVQPEGILGGIVSLLESATGVFKPKTGGKARRGVNDMMSYAEMKYHLTRTIGASEKDRTASIFMDNNTFRRWLNRVGKATKNTTSYIQLISAILPHIHYEWNSVAAPPFVPQGESLTMYKNQTVTVKHKGSGDIADLIKWCKKSVKALKIFLNKHTDHKKRKKMDRSIDPCAFDPGFGDDDKPTPNPDVPKLFTKITGPGHIGQWSPTTARSKGVAARDAVAAKVGKRTNKADRVYEAFEEAAKGIALIEKYKNSPLSARQNHFVMIQEYLEKAAQRAGGGSITRTRTITEEAAANSRLHCFLFRPDLYMCPPPKCNVLFPDMITSIFFTRNWMSEVTRLWLFTVNSSGRERNDMYFSPNTTILGENPKKSQSSTEQAVKNRVSFHMDHEMYTGITATFEAVADWKQMKKAYKKQIKEGGEKIGGHNDHLVKAANFMFFKKRYQGRTIQLTLRYSPQLIAGLPCMVLDPIEGTDNFLFKNVSTDEEVRSRGYKKSNGKHYFGVIDNLQHIADANGGAQTRVTLTHCRTHTESSQIFGGRGKESNWVFTSYTTKKLAAESILVEETGLNAAGVEEFNRDPEGVLGDKFDSKATYTFAIKRNEKGRIERGHFDEGHQSVTGKSAKEHNSENRKKVGYSYEETYPMLDADGNEIGTSFEYGDVVEEYAVPGVYVDVYKTKTYPVTKKVNFTFEAAVTPPWFSSCFLPDKIGAEYYNEMLGCASVIDGAVFNTEQLSGEDRTAAEEDSDTVAKNDVSDDTIGESEFVTLFKEFPITDTKTITTESFEVKIPKSLFQKSKSASFAAEKLAEAWLGLKRMDTDINVFIDTYVHRSYATMLDIFGNQNPQALKNISLGLGFKGTYPAEKVNGFHGYSFGTLDNLEGLDGAGERLVGGSEKKPRAVNPKIDTRQEKFTRVINYRNALNATRRGDG